MANLYAFVDLTLDSRDEDGNKAGSNAIQKARKGLSTRKDRRPESQDHRKAQKRESPNIFKAEPKHSGSKHRKSVNTPETAFDLTADEKKPSDLAGESTERAQPADPRMQRAAGASVELDTTLTRQDVYELESVGQPERSKSVKRRTTPLTEPSPSQGDSGRSVAFRASPLVSKLTPKDGRPKGSGADGEHPTSKAHTKNASQKPFPGPCLVPSPSTLKQSSSKNPDRRSHDAHGELTPSLLRATNSGKILEAETPSKSGSPALGHASKKSKRTVNSGRTPSGDVVNHQSPQPTVSVAANGTETSREATPINVTGPSADIKSSAAVLESTDLQLSDHPPALIYQQDRRDGQVRLDSPSNGGPGVQAVEILFTRPIPIKSQIGRSALCTGNDLSQSTWEASIPPQNKKMAIKDERAESTTSSLLLDEARVASPTPHASVTSANTKDSSGIPSGVAADSTKILAAAMVAKQTLCRNIERNCATKPAIDLQTTTFESHMEQCMHRHLKELHDHHEYFMKAWLGRARKACDRLATAKSLPSSVAGPNHTAGFMTVPEQYVQRKSPFVEMKPLRAPMAVKESQVQGPTGRLQQQILRLPKPVRPVEEMPVTMYTSDAVSVPPYLNYIPIRRNILAENDRSLKYYPYFGEDGPGKKSGLEKELEERFNNRIKHLPLRHWYAEQADKLLPYATCFLEEQGCTIEDILYLFLNPDSPIEPGEGSSSTLHQWYARCFATDSDRTSKKWQSLFCSMQSPEEQALAHVRLACKAFYTVTKLSLWYIVKSHEVTVKLSARLQEKKDTPSAAPGLNTYTNLGCLMCHVHDCPCHGEYEEPNGEKDTDGRISMLKNDSNSEDVDSDSDNGMTHNLRKRVVAEPHMIRDYRTQRGPVAYIDNAVESVQDFLGMNDDGTIDGIWNRTGDRGNPGFPDTELCSPQCFWKKANRTVMVSKWSQEQLEFLQTLLPAYIASRRGPCMMAYAFDKPCQEVFNMMRSVSSIAPQDEMLTTLPNNRNGRPIPRRGWQYWQKNSVTHIHEERNPFRPCSHKGSCQDAACPCYKANITCEKSCQCAKSCERRFRGCNCAQGNQVCWMSERCDCYQLNRECDPDLCGSCGACEVLDPVNRYNEKITHRKCSNVYMQRGIPKRTLMGHSDIQGWGLYIGEDVKANEFLGEYKGEIVSKTEGDRRGAVYHYRGIEYLFGLNKTQEIDSTRAGNKMRFINNSKKHINCYPRKVLCNTVQRIGMYAKRDLVSGEELYFDYGYPESVTKNFWDKGEPKVPTGSAGTGANAKKGKTTAVKQGEVSSSSAKVEKGEATKKGHGGRPPKHGGARSGAGRKTRAVKASSAPSGKRADAEAQGEESRNSVVAADPAVDEVEEMDVIESEGDGDDDAVSEVDPYALEESESEDDSYVSAGEEDVAGKARGKRPSSNLNGRVGGSAQKRGWITRKENLKRKRGY